MKFFSSKTCGVECRNIDGGFLPRCELRHQLGSHWRTDQSTMTMSEGKDDLFVVRTEVDHRARIRKARAVSHPVGAFSIFKLGIHLFPQFEEDFSTSLIVRGFETCEFCCTGKTDSHLHWRCHEFMCGFHDNILRSSFLGIQSHMISTFGFQGDLHSEL